jgi:hypothetical protein
MQGINHEQSIINGIKKDRPKMNSRPPFLHRLLSGVVIFQISIAAQAAPTPPTEVDELRSSLTALCAKPEVLRAASPETQEKCKTVSTRSEGDRLTAGNDDISDRPARSSSDISQHKNCSSSSGESEGMLGKAAPYLIGAAIGGLLAYALTKNSNSGTAGTTGATAGLANVKTAKLAMLAGKSAKTAQLANASQRSRNISSTQTLPNVSISSGKATVGSTRIARAVSAGRASVGRR